MIDSIDMFATPATQAIPPTDHLNNDELDSEGFVTMPAIGVNADDCLQSQVVLKVEEFGKQSPNEPYFDDTDAIDLEMSKMEWNNPALDAKKNKSASVTPDLDFEALPSDITKSIMETLASPEQLKVPNVLFHSVSVPFHSVTIMWS